MLSIGKLFGAIQNAIRNIVILQNLKQNRNMQLYLVS